MVEWLAGNRIKGTSTERTAGTPAVPADITQGGWKEVGRTTIQTAPTNTLTSTQGNNGGSGQHSSGACIEWMMLKYDTYLSFW